jgi:hypothetical protein
MRIYWPYYKCVLIIQTLQNLLPDEQMTLTASNLQDGTQGKLLQVCDFRHSGNASSPWEAYSRKLFLECCTLRRLLECYWVFPECIWHSGKHASPVVPASCNLRPATHNHRCRHGFEMRLGSARHRCGWWGAMLSRVWCGHIPSLSALQDGHSHYHRLRLHPHCGRHRLDVRLCEGGFYHTMLEVLKEGGRRTSRDTAGSAAICEQERGKGCWR